MNDMPKVSSSHGPRISVITINSGRDRHLGRLLEGLLRGIHPDECIVVEIGSDVSKHDGFVRHIPLVATGLPLAAARNAGRQNASGDILIFLDVDCIPSADLVPTLTNAVTRHDGLVCCEVLYLPDGAVGDGWTEAALDQVGWPHPARNFPVDQTIPAPHPGLFWSLAFGVRATTFDRIGGFDETFSGYGAEDTDFAFRAAALSVPTFFTPGGRAFHQRHAAFDPPLHHLQDITRNAVLFHKHHGFWPMRDWLDAFIRMGLIALTAEDTIMLLRHPSADEIEAARVPATRPF